ncbi:MAG: prepilin-type N-terminal cleavage/methylation domain-containing protein [Deltaproteobacteria bacterium]
MARRRNLPGFTLIEVMMAMLILLIGASGMVAVYMQGQRMHTDSLRATRGMAIAQDLLNNIEQWPYANTNGKPLYNRVTSNDGDIGDTAFRFETSANPVSDGLADHGEADLPANFPGTPAASLAPLYERYWNVSYPPDAAGVGIDAANIAVIVRWPSGPGWRRVVLMSAKSNPAAVH